MIQLLFFLLLLLLLELQTHEFDFLLCHGAILHSLAFERFILLLKIFNYFFELLDPLSVGLFFLFLSLILCHQLSLELLVELRIVRCQVLVRFSQLLQLSFQMLLLFVPLLATNGVLLLLVFQLTLKFEDLFAQLLHLLGERAELKLILLLLLR